jgi:fermentation-respiration switch protein FrsA (DUF1100 family)
MDVEYAKKITANPLSIPSLAVVGESDQFVPPPRSQQLINALGDGVLVFQHPGAHMMPTCSGDCKLSVSSFLDKHKDW